MGAACSIFSHLRGTAWFGEVFGFGESYSYRSNQQRFAMDGDVLTCKTSPWPRQHVGAWETPSVAELRERCAGLAHKPSSHGLRFLHLATLRGVQALIADPSNAGAVFQVASQFNALEMVGPDVSPRDGVAIYALDPTQGPKSALACPAATVFRNYLVNGKGQGETQIDNLADLGAVVGNGQGVYYVMRNGYALPATSGSIAKLGSRLEDDRALAAAAEAALRVGIHWGTQVRPPKEHRVCQVFASALPVSYASIPSADWAPFAKLVLGAAYDATLLAARCKAAEAGGRVRVYLTCLGGGAFGNRPAWIRGAIQSALRKHRDAPLDVFLVHFGGSVPSVWDIGQ